MLSILIPIYNFNVVRLVKALRKQADSLKISYEILCFDDGSKSNFRKVNRSLSSWFGVSYVELNRNIGRSSIRNKLAKSARYSTYLFIDCDSRMVTHNYLKNYIPFINENKIIYGGRSYSAKPPKSVKKRLHWKYGTKREALTAEKRRIHPYRSFLSNNFLISRSLFERFQFDQNFSGYGYEDLAYAAQLNNSRIPILHVDNPLYHVGLEETDVFIQKHFQALENLSILYQSGIESKLTKVYDRLKKNSLLSLVEWRYCKRQEKLYQNLCRNNPSLFYFDILRLCKFHQIQIGLTTDSD